MQLNCLSEFGRFFLQLALEFMDPAIKILGCFFEKKGPILKFIGPFSQLLLFLLVLSGPAEDGGDARPALWACTEAGEQLEQLFVFESAVARKHPEGVCRLADAQGGQLLVVLDGEDRTKGSEILFFRD